MDDKISKQALLVDQLAPDFAGCRLATLPMPYPATGKVPVAIKAALVNFPDLLMTRGEYQFKPPLPFVPGLEFSGIIDIVGEGLGSERIGKAVAAGARGDTMASAVYVPASKVCSKPTCLDWAEAAAYLTAYLSSSLCLMRRALVAADDWVLVHGTSGGVGMACVNLTQHLGARVIATSVSAEKTCKD